MHRSLLAAEFGNVSKHQHDTGEFSLVIPNGSSTVVNRANRQFGAILGDEQCAIRQSDIHALPQGSNGGTLDYHSSLWMDDFEYRLH